jgi:16S rRNA (adenine1518-N6/adenine1519-N6)-dimethyltransferase
VVSYARLDAVVRSGFGQRRKMLRRSLAGVVDPEAFARSGVRPEARAEELDIAAWGRLAAS